MAAMAKAPIQKILRSDFGFLQDLPGILEKSLPTGIHKTHLSTESRTEFPGRRRPCRIFSGFTALTKIRNAGKAADEF
jgi:hypothetical protein